MELVNLNLNNNNLIIVNNNIINTNIFLPFKDETVLSINN
jgi:hypothetical protein